MERGLLVKLGFCFSSDVGFGEGQSIAPPTQIIDVQEILKQANNPIDILAEYASDAILTGLQMPWMESNRPKRGGGVGGGLPGSPK